MLAWLCLHIVVLAMLLSGQRSSTVLYLPFFSLIRKEHLLEQLDDKLKGLLSLFQVLILVLLWTLTVFQRSIPAAIFCCTEQRQSQIFVLEGVSIFHCGSCPGQEKRFWWLGSPGSTPLWERIIIIFFVGVVHTYKFLIFLLFQF